jgi:hypothetical protein
MTIDSAGPAPGGHAKTEAPHTALSGGVIGIFILFFSILLVGILLGLSGR